MYSCVLVESVKMMAFWGAPQDNPNQAVDAVNAALEMLDNVERYRRDFDHPDFDIGIGRLSLPLVNEGIPFQLAFQLAIDHTKQEIAKLYDGAAGIQVNGQNLSDIFKMDQTQLGQNHVTYATPSLRQ